MAVQSQTTVTVHFPSNQLLLFALYIDGTNFVGIDDLRSGVLLLFDLVK